MKRTAQFPILDVILNRWSARSMSGVPVTKAELMPLFEAARWAPSSYDNQPWRFIYVLKGTTYWEPLFNLLVPFNQSWCKNAGALLVICSNKLFEFNNKPSRTHSFDTGAAWQNFALQGFANGLVIHAMEGFDYEKVRTLYSIPDSISIEAMIAVGHPGDGSDLSEELKKREEPSDRKLVEKFIFEGSFK